MPPDGAGRSEWPVSVEPVMVGVVIVKKKEEAIVDKPAATFLHLGKRWTCYLSAHGLSMMLLEVNVHWAQM